MTHTAAPYHAPIRTYFGTLSVGVLFAMLSNAAAVAEDPWADRVIAVNTVNANSGFNTPEKALGAPIGGGTSAPNNGSLHSIGAPATAPGSFITLGFDTPVTDDPLNPMGLDFIVYGNGQT